MSNVTICLFGTNAYDRAAQGVAGAGQRLAAELGGKLQAIVIGGGEGDLASSLAGVAGEVLHVDAPELAEYQPEVFLGVCEQLCRQLAPRAVLFGNDTYSQELVPRLAHRLGGSSAADAAEVAPAGEWLRVTRSAYGGKATVVYELRRVPAVVSLRARSYAPPEPTGTTAAITRPEIELPSAGTTKITERHVEAQEGIPLEDAQLIVSGGRGLGGPEGFQEIQKLAQTMGAAVGSSRTACDEGWAPPTWQIGQTGKKVAPELYIAVAISGAAQHVLGMADSKVIAAINTDQDAPIFKNCSFGIVEDYRKVVPLLNQKLAELKK